MMTRKDYVQTTQILLDHNDLIDEIVLHSIAQDFADYFAKDNPNFSTRLFFRALGLEDYL